MADILSTLRELRSLEEKRAHGTLSPEEETRFQELQNAVSSRGPKPGPPTSMPVASAAPTLAPVAAEDPPFVDAELTEEQTVVQAEPAVAMPSDMSAPLELAPPPFLLAETPTPPETRASPPLLAGTPAPTEELAPPDPEAQTAVAPEPTDPGPAAPVPMSPAELRQWNASFQPPESASEPAAPVELVEVAAAPSVFAAAPEEPASPAADWLPSTPAPSSAPAPSEPPPLELATPPSELFVDTAPEPTVAEDAPMVWSPPIESPAAEPTLQIAIPAPTRDDGWTASVSWSAGIPPPGLASEFTPEPTPEPISDNEPTKLVSTASVMDPFAPDTFEPAAFASPSQALGQADVSSAEVSTKKDTPIGEAFAAGESRVVIHTLGGVQKRGTITDAHMNADFLELRLQNGEREQLSTAGLKAVFFVVPIGQEVPKPVGDRVTVTLQDGHQLVGLSPDYQVGAVGFFLCPTDQRSRTAKIYIYAGSVKAIS